MKFRQKLSEWKAEGYDVSELESKWFPDSDQSETAAEPQPVQVAKPLQVARSKRLLAWAVSSVAVVIAGIIATVVFLPEPPDDTASQPTPTQVMPVAVPESTPAAKIPSASITSTPTQYTLRISVNPPDGGTVTPLGGRIDAGTDVIVSALASPGYVFVRWSGDLNDGTPSCKILMNSDKTITANFAPAICTLLVSAKPPDGGTIAVVSERHGSQSDSGQGSISYRYDRNTSLTLTAKPAMGFAFGYWSGDASGTRPTYHMLLDSHKSVVANFVRITECNLTIKVDDPTAGVVGVVPAPAKTPVSDPSNRGALIYTYPVGTAVRLVATPNQGYQFVSWSGLEAAMKTGPAEIILLSDMSVVASFEAVNQTRYIEIAKAIYNTIPYVEIRGSLKTGQRIIGSMEWSTPFTGEWQFHIYSPSGGTLWKYIGDSSSTKCSFSLIADETGEYRIRIVNVSDPRGNGGILTIKPAVWRALTTGATLG